MDIAGSTALVTGANRGIGRAITEELLARGAKKVYATARRPETVATEGVEALALDVTDAASVAAVAAVATDVDLVVNNAGISTGTDLVTGDLEVVRREVETHVFGPLLVVRAFAPVLAANGGGAVANVLSALSWLAVPGAGAYHVAKAGEWALTNALRLDLAAQGTQVTGVHLGAVDTDMMADYDGPKISPATVATALLDGVQTGAWEVLVDDWSRTVKASLGADPEPFYRSLSA